MDTQKKAQALDDDMLESSASEASQNEPASESRPRAKRRE